MRRLPRPPTIGEPLPRADEAYGIEAKVTAYCLNHDHEVGGPKAQGFQRILGIGLEDADYLAEELRAGVRVARISRARGNTPFGILCDVRVPVRGLRAQRSDRRRHDSWELRHADDRPRPVTAYIDAYPEYTMATVKHAISEHDVVVLRDQVGTWPAGTTGAVISTYDTTMLVEITGPGGKTLDTIRSLPTGSISSARSGQPAPSSGYLTMRLRGIDRW